MNRNSPFSPRSARNRGMMQLVITVLVLGVLAGVAYFAFGGPNAGKTSSISASAALSAARGMGVAAEEATALALSANTPPYEMTILGLANNGGFKRRLTDKSLFNSAVVNLISTGTSAGRAHQGAFVGVLGTLNPTQRALFYIVPGIRDDVCSTLGTVLTSTEATPLALAQAASATSGIMEEANFSNGTFLDAIVVTEVSHAFQDTDEFCVRTADNTYAYARRVWAP